MTSALASPIDVEAWQRLDGARQALTLADTPIKAVKIANGAELAKAWTRRAGASIEAQREWSIFAIQAQRKAGQLLRDMEKAPDGRPKKGVTETPFPSTIHDLIGAKTRTASKERYRKMKALALVPAAAAADYLAKAQEPTAADLLRIGKRAATEANRKRITDTVQPPADGVIEPGTVATITADPPWRYTNTSTRGAAEDHYPTMSIEELCDLDIARTSAAPESHLYLWTTAGHLPDAFSVMTAWGFDYKTYLVWIKPQIGMGNYFRISTELVLFGVRGGIRTRDRSLRNHFEAKRGRHSAKPWAFHDLVMKASPGPYLELFGRCRREEMLHSCECSRCRLGWQIWGNQT